ncbi:MAG: hypothetical protein GY857_03210 [Desulfobacula sp.]|nr:hypothetical protein [Desulfobacula sp.]
MLATCGSRGDVQPMIAIALALKSAGHDVLLLGPPEKSSWAEELGCPYMGFGQNVTAFLNQIKNSVSLGSSLAFISFVRQELKTQFKVLPHIIKNADLVIGASLMFGLSSIAEALGVRYQYIVFTPQIFPSSFHPFLTIKTQNLPKWCNRLSWELIRLMDKFNLTFLINRYRKKMMVAHLDNAWKHILGENTIVACDWQILKVPHDVKPGFIQTGYPHLNLPDKTQTDLDQFLKNGSRPIYAGFGSMPPQEQNKTIPILVKAARNSGRRIIIAKFWKEDFQYQSCSDVFFLKNYPHLKLFPKTAAVIHHGGAGTTATAAISGVPQIIVPHILDQYYHGQKIYLSSLGAKPVWRSKLSVDRLSDALEQCLFSPAIKQNAKKIKSLIDQNRSLNMIVKAVERSK